MPPPVAPRWVVKVVRKGVSRFDGTSSVEPRWVGRLFIVDHSSRVAEARWRLC